MVAFPRPKDLISNVPSIGGVAAGALVAAGFAVMPHAILERAVWASGIAAFLPAAAPPLGLTARAVLALLAGGLTAAIAWSALYLVFGPGGLLEGAVRRNRDAPQVRRADAHPDAPPRRPVSAAELGTPLMDVPPVERPLPRDLEQPLAAFDPAAIPAEPLAPVRPVAALFAKPIETPAAKPITRIETFALNPVSATAPRPAPAAPQSIEALLRRLEQGASRRVNAG